MLSIPYTNGGGGTLTLNLDPRTTTPANTSTSPPTAAAEPMSQSTARDRASARGTLILTDQGEVAVEDLQIGDLVVRCPAATPDPLDRPAATQRHFAAGRPDILPVRIAAGALADGLPRRDLFVSPLHAMFLDGVLVPASALVNGSSIVQPRPSDESNTSIWNWKPTTSSWPRARRRKPSSTTAAGRCSSMPPSTRRCIPTHDRPPRYCAPRVEDGEALEDILTAWHARRRHRAGASAAGREAQAGAAGPLLGHLDVARRDVVGGWAWDAQRPHAPVALEILNNGAVVARVTASDYRMDLENAGVGDGRHGFLWRIPGGLPPHQRHVIQVRRAGDDAELGQSPRIVEAARPGSTRRWNKASPASSMACCRAPSRSACCRSCSRSRSGCCSFARTPTAGARPAWPGASTTGAWAARRMRRPMPSADPGLRALVVDDRLPDPARDGGSQAILSHMRALRALGYEVSIVAAHEPLPGSARVAALAAEDIVCWRTPQYATVEEVLRRQADCFDVIYLHRAAMASAYLALARQHCPRARILYSVADLHHLRLSRQARVESRPELLAQSRRFRQIECNAAWSAHAVLTHSTQEADWLRRAVLGAKVHHVPFAQAARPTAVDVAARHGVAFIGNYAHAPNADAARFLVEEIMPLVWRHDRGIACLLAGSDMPESIRKLERTGVTVLDHVPDLSSVFDRVRLTAAPLRFGAGVKGKVVASLGAGVPCVMSPVGAEGMVLPASLAGLVGESAARSPNAFCGCMPTWTPTARRPRRDWR